MPFSKRELEIMLEILAEEIEGILNPSDYRRELQFLYDKILEILGIPKEEIDEF